MKRRVIVFLFLCIPFILPTRNSVFAQTGDAGQPGEFLRYGVGARALGMGHAFTALANDASAVYYNPAGLIGVERKEFTSMYSNLFYDSRYTYMAVALPRTFTGNSNALGFGWVNLTMANFDGRDICNNQTGNFDIYQQAFMLSGAREWVGTWGILNYGVNLKIINQGFPGYQSEQGWGFGADVGATFKPINAPLFKIFALRYLMPLQLGVSLQNLLPPSVGVGGNKKDPYPFIFRWGAGYNVHIKEWRIQLLYDQEKYSGRAMGHYAGLETNLPFMPYMESYAPTFRFGYNSRTKRPGFGAGFKFGFAGNSNIRLDFAYSIKPQDELKDDFRLFLTVDFGQKYDADYFLEKTEYQPQYTLDQDTIICQLESKKMKSQEEKQKTDDFLQVLVRDPNNKAEQAAELLGTALDISNRPRYYKFIGGLRWADELFRQAVCKLRNNDEKGAQGKAKEAVSEYEETYRKDKSKFISRQLLNYCESCLIAGEDDRALNVLTTISDTSLRKFYLSGIAYQRKQDWHNAKDAFSKAVAKSKNSRDMRKLAQFGLGLAFFNLDEYNKAISALQLIIHAKKMILQPDYPCLPIFKDNILADDAMFLVGECYLNLDDKKSALSFFASIEKYFPHSDNINFANKKIGALIK